MSSSAGQLLLKTRQLFIGELSAQPMAFATTSLSEATGLEDVNR